MNKLSLINTGSPATYTKRDLLPLYRAYMQGAYDAIRHNDESERENSFRLTLAAMGFALIGWFITMYFVFK